MSEKFINREYLLDSFKDYNTDIVEKKFDQVNSNLSNLKYGEIVGGKNLVNIIDYESKAENNYTYKFIPYKFELGKKYTISGNCERVSGVTNKLLTITLYNSLGSVSDSQVSDVSFASGKFSKTFTINENNINANSILIYTGTSGATLGNDYKFSNIQLEEGTTATDYEPYIPSVKMLAEEVNQQNESLSALGKCKNLLKPTLQTSTQNGVTCTNNGDGTYTLNGTANVNIYFFIQSIVDFAKRTTNKDYKLVGCPVGSNGRYDLRYEINGSVNNGGNKDFGNGCIVKNDKVNSADIIAADIIISIMEGFTANNLIFKPMLTTNLGSAYDDFVPYTGDGDTLAADVAELKNDLGGLSFSVSGTTLSITDGTNTWTLTK